MNSFARLACVLGLTMFGMAEIAHARIKLISLPVRDRVEMRLDHISATLVEEERTGERVARLALVKASLGAPA